MINVLRIREIREIQYLTVSQFAYKSGIARGFIKELENAKYENISLEIISKLSEA